MISLRAHHFHSLSFSQPDKPEETHRQFLCEAYKKQVLTKMDDQMPADLVVLYQDAFKHFDCDNTGIITTKQLGPLLRFCGENPSEAEIQVQNPIFF